ncbi:GNAT family N-acetyltransferase [Leucothrix pacifica]|uniref:N-acetyltransferase n=1 Tax=Leucothrix pacifica TaxID=1247513 RepID=A0A317C2F7_9GAMM|nr:GNAT family N-acetyltransferase [Leucothrix pacifica]PWQ92804.1 N-acetyltransferase [Leucothrix pacifica]
MNNQEQPSLKTTGYYLRPFRADDADTVQLLAADKRISEMVSNIPHPYPEGAALAWINSHRPAWDERSQASFAIVDKANHQLLGAIGLSIKPADNGLTEAEVGYWLGVEYWGRGIVSEACQRIVKFGLDELALDRICARRLSANPASGRVLEKAGFRHTGTAEGSCGDKFTSLDYYEILKS